MEGVALGHNAVVYSREFFQGGQPNVDKYEASGASLMISVFDIADNLWSKLEALSS